MKKLSITLALVFVSALALMAFGGVLPILILLIFVGMSVVTYVIYWWDKSAARKGKWRTPESTLHILAVAGGWPGALIAQQTLRHKTQKQSFRWVFWLTVLVNVGVFIWFFTQGYFKVISQFLELAK